MKKQTKSYGYYFITLHTPESRRLLQTNNERAFIISQLQDLLSPRLFVDAVPAHKQLASCIDLLSFSITAKSIHLLVFTIDASIASHFAGHLNARLMQYRSEYQPSPLATPKPHIQMKKLRGPHHALTRSVEMHSLHEDWEYDRYSSIGFYLHDRRGDWMRLWRLTRLYDNDSSSYRLLVEEKIGQRAMNTRSILRLFAS